MSGLFLQSDSVDTDNANEIAAVVPACAPRPSTAPLPRPVVAMPNVADRGRIKFGAGFRNASK